MSSYSPSRLQPHQLADLLNYALGLPLRMGTRTIVKPAFDPFIPATWGMKARGKTERWLEAVLGIAARDSKPKDPHDRGIKARPPFELDRYLWSKGVEYGRKVA